MRGNSRSAFSLLELSVVLTILGVFAGGMLTYIGRNMDHQNRVRTGQKLDVIEETLLRFQRVRGYLPCPASATAAESNLAFGAATDCTANATCVAGAAPAGTADAMPAAVTADCVRTGALPFRTLGLSPSYAYDEWGGRISYAAIKSLAQNASAFEAYAATATTGVIQVRDAPDTDTPAGNQLTPALAGVHVGFIAVSHGRDGKGAYLPSGVLRETCGTAANDSENCDGDLSFADMTVNESATAADYYYDLVRWRSFWLD